MCKSGMRVFRITDETVASLLLLSSIKDDASTSEPVVSVQDRAVFMRVLVCGILRRSLLPPSPLVAQTGAFYYKFNREGLLGAPSCLVVAPTASTLVVAFNPQLLLFFVPLLEVGTVV